ncbi:hypothetical protein JAAARDRAFT_36367 [Jaapia argillacea MUCL 33604]|uniref:Uncharacterized protein n=1 Tax=Jaapia argillacea MUCL 33604 TaxID=933084 RepID=A0A067PQ29_9AGAM|nr:hypothetical protein JAAARDRAFT_36367 [Jaapia argillacea MUCL 33604]
MFQNFVRRISSSFLPRPDRPWSEDATSNAPQIGRKRRLSTPEPEAEEQSHRPTAKRSKTDEGNGSGDTSGSRDESPKPVKETEEVKEIREGVKEVHLEVDGTGKELSGEEAVSEVEVAAAVPLPEDMDDLKEPGDLETEEDEKHSELERPTSEASPARTLPSATILTSETADPTSTAGDLTNPKSPEDLSIAPEADPTPLEPISQVATTKDQELTEAETEATEKEITKTE